MVVAMVVLFTFIVSPCCCRCLVLISLKTLSMVVALLKSSSFVIWVSLNNYSACSFSLLSFDLVIITNAFLNTVSSAVRHTWYCSGRFCVVYSLMFSLACSRKYCTSSPIKDVDTFSRCAISAYVKPRPLNSMTWSLRHCNKSALLFVLKFPDISFVDIYGFQIFSFICQKRIIKLIDHQLAKVQH